MDDMKDKVGSIFKKAKKFTGVAVDKMGDIAETIGEKTEEIVDISKKKLEIEKAEFQLVKKYKELGKLYYAQRKTGLTEELDILSAEITVLIKKIAELKANFKNNAGEEAEDMDEDKVLMLEGETVKEDEDDVVAE